MKKKSIAFTEQSEHYPSSWRGKVPVKVLMTKNVRSDIPLPRFGDLVVYKDTEYEVDVNSHGAVSAYVGDRLLGLKPYEFEVSEWMEREY